MKRIVLIFGAVLGLLLCINLFYTVSLFYSNPNFVGNHVVGYAVMVVIFSLTFFGIRNYRNQQVDGVISLGKAFKIGALIALVGATMYVIVWLFYYYMFVPDFIDKYTQHVLNAAATKGTSAAELAEKTQEMENFKEMYKNPFFVILITYAEVLPVALIVAFVSSLILKRKQPV